MHKRSEVEIRVAQELKNNRDFIYQTNQSIQDLNNKINDLAQKNATSIAKVQSEHKELLISLENLSDEVLKSYHMISNRVKSIEDLFEATLEAFQELKEDVSDKYLTKEQFRQTMVPEIERLRRHEDSTLFEQNAVRKEIDKVQDTVARIIASDFKKFKNDLEFQSSKEEPLKRDIKEKMDIFRVNFDGLLKEIHILKKKSAYDQKKFEQIYTLIDRLKECN